MMNVHSSFEVVSENFPHNTAICSHAGSISYDALNGNSNRLAHALLRLGLPPESIIGLYLSASIEYVLAAIAVIKSGAVFMPISKDFPPMRLSGIIEKTRPAVIITTEHLVSELTAKLGSLGCNYTPQYIVVLNSLNNFSLMSYGDGKTVLLLNSYSESNPARVTGPEDACYIMITSGSTGEPKAILGSHKGLAHFLNWEITEFRLTAGERVSQLSPVTFDVSLRDIFVPLLLGGTLYIPDEYTRTTPGKLAQWLKENDITLVHIVPTLFRSITGEISRQYTDSNPYPALKHVLIAGEVLHWSDVDKWREAAGKSAEIVNLYGPSETTLAKLFYRIGENSFNQHLDGSVPIGRPISDTKVIIRNDTGECPADTVGEICIATEFRSKGYYNAPHLTSRVFIQNPAEADRQEIIYRTGDLGAILPDGNIRFIGRADNQVKLNGVRIEIDEIESVLNRHPGVRQSAVVVVENAFGDKQLAAYIVPKDDQKPAAQSLKTFLAHELPHYMLPATYVEIDRLPLTHSGKVDRNALRGLRRTRPEMGKPYVPPANETEEKICSIWSQVLNLDKVGTHDNFFDLGGSSLLVVRSVEMINREFKSDLAIVRIFEYPQISLLANYITNTNTQTDYLQGIQERAQRRRSSAANQRIR